MDDLRAVIDAAGVDRSALLGVSEGGPMSVLFAATYPERVVRLSCTGPPRGCPSDPRISLGDSHLLRSRRI